MFILYLVTFLVLLFSVQLPMFTAWKNLVLLFKIYFDFIGIFILCKFATTSSSSCYLHLTRLIYMSLYEPILIFAFKQFLCVQDVNAYIWVNMHMCTGMCGGLRLMSTVLVNCLPKPYSLSHSLS